MTRNTEHALLIDELRDIQAELLDAVQRAEHLLKQSAFDGARLRAEAYWIPHIVCALSRDHGYLGGSMVTLEDTINEIAEHVGEGDEDGDAAPEEEAVDEHDVTAEDADSAWLHA